MSAHTAGPWFVQSRHGGFIDIVHTDKSKGAITRALCRVQSRDSWIEESEANAELIAAAPAMLEALKDAHPHISNDALRKRIGRIIIEATWTEQ